jgi:hypothetical protein
MSKLSAALDEARRSAEGAERKLRASLKRGGVELPSLGVDRPGYVTGVVLVELGRARPDVALRLAELIDEGVNARDGRPA